MYCKCTFTLLFSAFVLVLIVAKCIVNNYQKVENITESNVLIVAKCIVNHDFMIVQGLRTAVLIVAKCIVNAT